MIWGYQRSEHESSTTNINQQHWAWVTLGPSDGYGAQPCHSGFINEMAATAVKMVTRYDPYIGYIGIINYRITYSYIVNYCRLLWNITTCRHSLYLPLAMANHHEIEWCWQRISTIVTWFTSRNLYLWDAPFPSTQSAREAWNTLVQLVVGSWF